MNTFTYLLGISTMFFALMAWFFWRKSERLHKFIAILSATIAVQYVKDFVAMEQGLLLTPLYWNILTAIDMVAIPMYVCILKELIHPGALTRKAILLQESPFVLLPIAYILTLHEWIYHALVAWAIAYGTYYLLWASINIPHYNQHLKEHYSYTENINLNWLRSILYAFYAILLIWIMDCLIIHIDTEQFYIVCNLTVWMFVCYFTYRHESVIGELGEEAVVDDDTNVNDECAQTLASKIEDFFMQEKAYLNPRLKLSDVARSVGSNRTYVSNYFNKELNTTFFDYVNNLRIDYACQRLRTGSESLDVVALNSGFNSLSTFHRVFSKTKGITPAEYRRQ